MLYSRDGRWGILPKKITYKTVQTTYDVDESAFINNPNYTDVVVEDILLTPEEAQRFELVRDDTSIPEHEVLDFIKNGVVGDGRVSAIINNNAVTRNMRDLVDWSTLNQEQIDGFLESFETWEPVQTYVEGQKVTYANQLYTVITPGVHMSQLQYTPDKTPSVYAKIGVPGTISEWELRDGSNPYKVGDVVKFEGSRYKASRVTAYSPTEYPSDWEEIVEIGSVADWVQKSYTTGDKVRFKGVVYENILPKTTPNVWSPEAYPTGWLVVKE